MKRIARWLAGEMTRLGVDVRLNTLATASDVVAETPDVVVIATGGLPETGDFPGRELAATVWDVLLGAGALLRSTGGNETQTQTVVIKNVTVSMAQLITLLEIINESFDGGVPSGAVLPVVVN